MEIPLIDVATRVGYLWWLRTGLVHAGDLSKLYIGPAWNLTKPETKRVAEFRKDHAIRTSSTTGSEALNCFPFEIF